ncbi:hypothetical protein QBC39DRAFT_257606 [Podospora conica]|nr:hypothetical protein QBC39DRAFT_257606 [Schizothecium conicum]
MPSQYWSGRFMSLHDKARSQMLEKHNLGIIIEAQARRAPNRKPQDQTAPVPINPYNNPSTSIYAPPRAHSLRTSNNGAQPLRMPHSATTTAIHDVIREASYHIPPAPHAKQPPYTQPPLRLPSQPIAPPSRPGHQRRESGQCNSLSNAAQRGDYHHNNPTTTTTHELLVAEAAVLTDDDRRCRLALAELDGLCATDAALRSFRAWQLEYARKTRRRELLPVGATMEEESHQQQKRGRTMMGGLFMGSSSGAGRKSESCYLLSGLGGTTAGGYYVDRDTLVPPPVPALTASGGGGEGWRPRLRMSLSTTDAVSACGGPEVRRKRRIPGLLGGF